MKAAIIIAIALLLLMGCASPQPAPPLPPKIVEIKVPVAVPCIAEIPPAPAIRSNSELLALPDHAFIDALHADRLLLLGHDEKLQALLEACTAER